MKSIISMDKFKGSVLRPGPARRVDPGPGRPGPGTGPGGGKNPLESWPGDSGSTRDPDHPVKPGWDTVYFFFRLIDVKRRRFGLCFKGQNDEEQWSRIELGILITDYRANLINKHINFNRWAEEQRRAEDRRRLDHCCFTAKKVSFLFLFTSLLLSPSLFFILGRVLNLQFWASFCCSLIQSRWFSCSPVISTSGMFLCSFFYAT